MILARGAIRGSWSHILRADFGLDEVFAGYWRLEKQVALLAGILPDSRNKADFITYIYDYPRSAAYQRLLFRLRSSRERVGRANLVDHGHVKAFDQGCDRVGILLVGPNFAVPFQIEAIFEDGD